MTELFERMYLNVWYARKLDMEVVHSDPHQVYNIKVCEVFQ